MDEPILVVDDIEDWRKTISGLLEDEGYHVKTAGGVEEALALLETTFFRLALVDVRLDEPDEDNRDGLKLMHQINELYPTVAVIILTGYADVEMVQEALQPGSGGKTAALGFIRKNEAEWENLADYVRLAYQRPLVFNPTKQCQIVLSLKPGQPLDIRAQGSIRFSNTSEALLSSKIEKLSYWGDGDLRDFDRHRPLVKKLGEDLYSLLFEVDSSILNGYQRALGGTSKKQYLHLVFETTRDLASLPLEFLYSEEHSEYLVLLHPFIRQIQGVVTKQPPITAKFIHDLVDSGEKLRVLILASNTQPSVPLIDGMAAELRDLLSDVDWIDLTYVDSDHATAAKVEDLLDGCQYHMVHYIGHGKFKQKSPEQSCLLFREQGNQSSDVKEISGDQLGLLLRDAETSFFHLTCCEGTQSGEASDLVEDDYLGIADGIIQAGVPSVLGYRWPVAASRAKDMLDAFYPAFLAYGNPQSALLFARKRLAMQDKDDLTWLSPMLIIQS